MRMVRVDNVPNAITVPTFSSKYSEEGTNKCYALNMKHYKHNEYDPENIKKGKEGERMVVSFLRNKWGFPVIGNKLDDSYPTQRGPDIRHTKSKFIGGVKNNNGLYSMNWKWLKEQRVLEEFEGDAKIKVLFVAHDRTTKEVKKILKDNNILLVEWGEQLLGQSWKTAFSNMYKQLYPIYYRVRRYLISTHIIKYNIANNDTVKYKEIKLTDSMDKKRAKPPPDPRGGWFRVPELQWLLGGIN